MDLCLVALPMVAWKMEDEFIWSILGQVAWQLAY